MSQDYDATVIIGTHNRSGMLAGAVDSVLAQHNNDVRYQLIVVDNNSTDDTRAVVESYIVRGHNHLQYIFEPRPGVSHARNSGIANARAPIIAFTDDDIRVSSDWVSSI